NEHIQFYGPFRYGGRLSVTFQGASGQGRRSLQALRRHFTLLVTGQMELRVQRMPFPDLASQRHDHGEFQATVSGVVQNHIPDELYEKGFFDQRVAETAGHEALRTGM